LGPEPGDRFIDALLERDCRLAEQIIGFVHRRDVVGDHAAVAVGSAVEGLFGQGGAEDGARAVLLSVGMRWQILAGASKLWLL
jgi:hypothetical protein